MDFYALGFFPIINLEKTLILTVVLTGFDSWLFLEVAVRLSWGCLCTLDTEWDMPGSHCWG